MKMRNKKAAMELSMSTIVVLVLAMTMLILGLVLVRAIFTGATESVNEINEKVKGEITDIFAKEGKQVAVKLGSDRTARVKVGKDVGILIAAKTRQGDPAAGKDITYKMEIDTGARDNCYERFVDIYGRTNAREAVEELFIQKMDTTLPFDSSEGDTAYALIQVEVPEGTPLCSQKIFIKVDEDREPLGSEFFIVDIIRSGIF